MPFTPMRSSCLAVVVGVAIASWLIGTTSACTTTRSPADASAPDASIEAVVDASDDVANLDATPDAPMDAAIDGAITAVDPLAPRRAVLKEFLENKARFHLSLSPSLRASFDAKCERSGGAKARATCRAALLDEAASTRAELTIESLFSRFDRPGDPPRFALRVFAIDDKGARVIWHRVGGLVGVDLDRLSMTPDAHDDGARKLAAPPDRITITAPTATTIEIAGLEPEPLVFIRM